MAALLLNIIMIILCSCCILLCYIKGYTLKSTVQIQNIVWLTAFLIYTLEVVKYYDMCIEVYVCACGYLFAYNGVYLYKSKKKKRGSHREFAKALPSKKVEKRCMLASMLMWILSIGILKKSIPILVGSGTQGMNLLRYTMYGSEGLYNTYEMVFISYIVRPVFIVTIILMATEIALRKLNKKLLIVSIIDALMIVLMTAGRTMMVSFVIYVIMAVVAVNGIRIVHILKKYRKYIIFGAALLCLFVMISTRRINNENSVVAEVVRYYFSALPFFSEMIKEGIAQPFILWGTGLFSAFVDPVLLLYRFFGDAIMLGSQVISNTANVVLQVGEDVAINATASTLFPFYLDFGLIGPVIGGVSVGSLAKYCEKKLDGKMSCLSFARYLFIMHAALTSVQNYALVGEATIMTWFLMSVLLKDKDKRKRYIKGESL